MADTELNLLIQLKDSVSAQLRQMNAEIQTNAKTWKDNYGAISLAMTGAGLAMVKFGQEVTGAFLSAYQASEESRVANALLANQMKNVGVSYDSVKDSLNQYMGTLVKSTGYSRDEQTAALSKLILVTGNYGDAVKNLPLVLNLSAAAHMDTSEAAKLLGRVMEGDVNILHRYLGAMDGAKTSAEQLDWMQKNLTGSAEAANTPLKQLNDAIKELRDTIGELISGPAGKIIKFLTDAATWVNDWAKKNPELAKTLLEVGGAIGIASIVVGWLALAFVAVGVAIHVLGGPLSWILLAIAALIAIGILMALHWDEVQKHWTAIWAIIKSVLVVALGPIGYLIGLLIQSAFDFMAAWDPTADFWTNLWKGLLIVAKNFMNDIVFILNIIPRIVNSVLGMLGVGFKFGLFPEITPDMLKTITGIDISARAQAATGAAAAPVGGGAGTVNPINWFGNFGGLGQTGVMQSGNTTITFNIAGDVTSDKDFFEKVRQYFIQLGYKNVTTGIK